MKHSLASAVASEAFDTVWVFRLEKVVVTNANNPSLPHLIKQVAQKCTFPGARGTKDYLDSPSNILEIRDKLFHESAADRDEVRRNFEPLIKTPWYSPLGSNPDIIYMNKPA